MGSQMPALASCSQYAYMEAGRNDRLDFLTINLRSKKQEYRVQWESYHLYADAKQ